MWTGRNRNGHPDSRPVLREEGTGRGKKKTSSRGRMEEVRENPRLAGRLELCEEILHFSRGVGIKG